MKVVIARYRALRPEVTREQVLAKVTGMKVADTMVGTTETAMTAMLTDDEFSRWVVTWMVFDALGKPQALAPGHLDSITAAMLQVAWVTGKVVVGRATDSPMLVNQDFTEVEVVINDETPEQTAARRATDMLFPTHAH